MDEIIGVVYVLAEVFALALVLLAIVRIGFVRLGSVVGIARDGFPPGKRVPTWSLLDLDGKLHGTPQGTSWQMLLFANRSLVAFPELVAGIERVIHILQDVEVLLITQEKQAEAQITAEGLGLHVPVISVQRRRLLRGIAFGFPLLEVGLGLAAVSALWPQIINFAMLALTALFTFVVLFALRKNLQVACRCFGALSDSQFSRKGLVRSLILTLVAACLCGSGGTYLPDVSAAPASSLLLVADFILFAFAAAEAAKTLALLKERMS